MRRMSNLRRIAGRGANALVFLKDQVVGREFFVRRVTPEFAAHPRMHALGKGFREAIGQRLAQDRGVIVVGILEAVGHHVFADPGGDDERADIVRHAAIAWRDEVGQSGVEAPFTDRKSVV